MHLSNTNRTSIMKARASKARCLCTANALTVRPSVNRPFRLSPIQSRSLWWWSRRRSEWSPYLDEHLQTRLQREQKIMRYKYSKALRRRALWEREATHPHWGWRVPHNWIGGRLFDGENMSSSSRLQADVQEPKHDEPSITRPMENQYSEEFAKFKAAVDKDPFAAVFGRRLESPPSSNNSSWTSLFRIFETVPGNDTTSTQSSSDPIRSSAPSGDKCGSLNRSSAPERPATGATQPSSTAKPVLSSEEAEYEFDPISMKKVPKRKLETQRPAKVEKKPFLATLFAEHGVDVPVKTYKPHKVYGYTGKDESLPESGKRGGPTASQSSSKKFESSRLQELQKLKASTLGNGVDATNFCGKYQSKEIDTKSAMSDKTKPSLDSEKSTDDAPLFSGTTYESKSDAIIATKAALREDWLAKEGFRTSSSRPAPSPSNATAPASPSKRTPGEAVSKIEPSLDRMQSAGAEQIATEGRFKQPMNIEPDGDKTEDLDLLRPSDVRAKVRSSRRTKQEIDLNKRDARQRLEADYISRHAPNSEPLEEAEDPLSATARKFQDGLSSLWKRVQNQPQYTNLANTIKNMGAFQDAWKKYSRDKIVEDPNERLVFKDPSLTQTPSIYKKTTHRANRAIDAFTPSKEVLDAERKSQTRAAALRAEREQSRREDTERKRAEIELASEIRQAYESQYGPIDVNHRQVSPAIEVLPPEATQRQIERATETETRQLNASQTPSSDILQSSTNPVVETENAAETENPPRVLESLQPRIDHLMDELRSSRKVLHEASLHVRAMKSCRPSTYWNTPIAEGATETAGSTIAKTPGESPEPLQLLASDINSSQESAAKDIAAYMVSVVSTNRSAARAQALQEMRQRRTNQVQDKEESVQPSTSQVQNMPDSAVSESEQLKANYVNQVQASEKAAVEASVEAPAQPVARDLKGSQGTEETTAIRTEPAAVAPNTDSSPGDTASPVQQAPAMYKVLAYDSSTLQISMATTTSSLYPSTSGNGDMEPPLHPTEVLSRLNNPAKFLPYFQDLQDEGYEIVSGSGDILVFKKVRLAPASTAASGAAQQVTTPAEPPNAPVQKDAATVLEDFPSKPAPAPPAPPSSPKVHRQEEVFSGSGKTWHQEEAQSQSTPGSENPPEGAWYKIVRGARRVFFTGLATAGIVYAVGAIAESFGAQQEPLYEEREVRRRGMRPGIYSTESSR